MQAITLIKNVCSTTSTTHTNSYRYPPASLYRASWVSFASSTVSVSSTAASDCPSRLGQPARPPPLAFVGRHAMCLRLPVTLRASDSWTASRRTRSRKWYKVGRSPNMLPHGGAYHCVSARKQGVCVRCLHLVCWLGSMCNGRCTDHCISWACIGVCGSQFPVARVMVSTHSHSLC